MESNFIRFQMPLGSITSNSKYYQDLRDIMIRKSIKHKFFWNDNSWTPPFVEIDVEDLVYLALIYDISTLIKVDKPIMEM